ncbi:hypothetical protein IQ05_00853 [Flavobacterium tiangeerense]|uniref:Tetratricopeptide repeat protein n=1 Tax=Flavobacterium tiangeerense TaxID=459471 RepID=A0ABY3FLE9_9FLAO|nr:hypothetical protein [Flavobacterium tiangeerense]TWI01277.1 hypothetical protein IQ05_00853 [Flavobacterium tiangeerense]
MKKTLIFLLFLISVTISAQKVDLDRFYFDVSYQALPKEPVPFEKRTYASEVKLGGKIQTYTNPTSLNERINIYGWKKVDEGATVKIALHIEDFVEKSVTSQVRVEENKDKEGRVTSRREYHYVLAKYSGRGYAKIAGPRTPIPLTAKQIEEEKAKQAAASTNRFLKNAVVKKDTVSDNGGFNWNFNDDIEVKSAEFQDAASAMKSFNLNRNGVHDNTLRGYVDGTVNRFNTSVNYSYGFKPISTNQILWILDAKNEEGSTQIEAIQAVRELFKNMKADQPIEDLKSSMQPLINYFDSLKTKYADDSKPARKMRYSAYYNLAVIYLLTDEPEKTIVEAEKLILNDYDKSDGKELINRANKLIEDFKIANTRSTHNPTLN